MSFINGADAVVYRISPVLYEGYGAFLYGVGRLSYAQAYLAVFSVYGKVIHTHPMLKHRAIPKAVPEIGDK